MGQLILQPDATSGIDAELQEVSPNTNFSTGNIRIGRLSNRAYRGYIEFDISSIPSGSTITSAPLQVYVTSFTGGATSCTVNRVNSSIPPEESEITWNSSSTGNLWLVPGGDFTTPTIIFNLPTELDEYVLCDLMSLAQDAIDNRNGILRMLFKMDNDLSDGINNYVVFRTSDIASDFQRPLFTVNFDGASGVTRIPKIPHISLIPTIAYR